MAIENSNKRAFTLIEIITVVAIIGILAAVAITSFMAAQRTARKNACVANLKQIQAVINTWALDTGADSDSTFTMADLVPGYIKVWPKEGTADYPLPGAINAVPVCPNVTANTDHTI